MNKKAEKISKITQEILRRQVEHKGERPGQRVVNALATVDKVLYNKLMELPAEDRPDPFYDDGKLEAFWQWFEGELDKQ